MYYSNIACNSLKCKYGLRWIGSATIYLIIYLSKYQTYTCRSYMNQLQSMFYSNAGCILKKRDTSRAQNRRILFSLYFLKYSKVCIVLCFIIVSPHKICERHSSPFSGGDDGCVRNQLLKYPRVDFHTFCFKRIVMTGRSRKQSFEDQVHLRF